MSTGKQCIIDNETHLPDGDIDGKAAAPTVEEAIKTAGIKNRDMEKLSDPMPNFKLSGEVRVRSIK
jgi:hypothetical protein